MFKKILCVILAAGMMSCGSGGSSQVVSTDSTATSNAEEVTENPVTELKPTFKFVVIKTVEDGEPATRLDVEANGKTLKGNEVSVPLSDGPYPSGAASAVPKDAIASCSGFWGGLQLEFYLLKQGDDFVLYEAAQDESTEAPVITEIKRYKAADFQ
ncbi:MAG: hypothetical protein EAZ57_06575 [Cytophagales bacterium]|nr:MAG: hypothetical protein EAZ67_07250 [Cytophagales bacterium]TAF60688.1 MAG: hypothetical protein EAZ57_06575 [Cytophagales bacterium]